MLAQISNERVGYEDDVNQKLSSLPPNGEGRRKDLRKKNFLVCMCVKEREIKRSPLQIIYFQKMQLSVWIKI
jgi:hypothetical protein